MTFTFLMVAVFSYGQSFSDDFDSYTNGEYLGSQAAEWTTWSNNPGSTEDVRISDERANSGTQSIKFQSSSPIGGPQDVVLFFGGNKLTSGQLDMSTAMFVESGAYFNLQAETSIGTTWAMNAFFEANGVGRITGSGNNNLVTFVYPENEWFEFSLRINFDSNKWTLLVNGECAGSFSNPDNSVESIDIFPLNGNSFFIDDFSYDYNPAATFLTYDAKVALNASETNGLVGTKTALSATMGNDGTEPITSFEVELDVNGHTTTVTEENVNIAQGETMDFEIDSEYAMEEGFSEVSVTITSVNGGNFEDEDKCNDDSKVFLFAAVPADHKKIVVEEATGTWCGWCPRGTVALERMAHKYPERFIGIAVHNNDPMADATYNAGLGATGFPNAVVNRGAFIDPSAIEAPFLGAVQEPSMSSMILGAEFDEVSRELSLSIEITALEDITANHKINMAITEDGVTGTGSDWGQANYYSGGSDLFNVDGTNWADLPNTVFDLVYDHVARAILAPYTGLADSFIGGLPAGESKIFNFFYTVPEDFNMENIHIVSMLINPNGSINTGESVTSGDAMENGFQPAPSTSTQDVVLSNATHIFPNPMENTATVQINLIESSDITISVVDMTGQTVMQKAYGQQNGLFSIMFDGSSLPTGMYVMKINNGEKYTAKRISIVR